MTYPNRGGRMPEQERNRPASAPGVGRNSKRHDLERRSTPFLHDSDLQQGDVQALEQGQRIAPKQTQRPAAPAAPQGSGSTTGGTTADATSIPDAIDFLSNVIGGGALGEPQPGVAANPNADKWLRFARHLVNGPGSSGLLAGAYINQMRQLMRSPQTVNVEVIDLRDVDEALAAALDEEEAFRGRRSAEA